MSHEPEAADEVFASLAGSAIGDAVGLPYENLSAARGARLLGAPDRFRLLLGRGMVSDDAEHACMTAAAIATSGGDVEAFRRDLARRLRWWILTVPPGVDLATLKATLRLWVGVPPRRSGVRSAGNGPAIRAAVLGRLLTPDALFEFVRASTELTHRDDRATLGAFAVATASGCFAISGTPELSAVLAAVESCGEEIKREPMLSALRAVEASLRAGESTADFAGRTCRRAARVSGYILETVPVARHAAFSAGDGLEAIRIAVRCGGDTDSVASIAGGIVGVADAGPLGQLIEWPFGEAWLRELARAAASRSTPPRFAVLRRFPRNMLLLSAVFIHVGRRCLPPYAAR